MESSRTARSIRARRRRAGRRSSPSWTLSEVVARAHIAQTEAAHLKVGDPATISVPGQSPDVKGKVTLVSPALDPNSTTVEVWVQAPNPGGRLRPGTSVRVTMVGETVPKAIVVPAAALLTAPDGVVSVMTLDTDNVPHKKKVKVGIRDGNERADQHRRPAGRRTRRDRGSVRTRSGRRRRA